MKIGYYGRKRISYIVVILCAFICLSLSTFCVRAENMISNAGYDNLPREYVITYHLNGGKNQNNPALYHDGEVLSLNSPTRTGYTFLGWYNNALFSGNPVAVVTSSVDGLQFYAKWERQSYKITYQYNGGKAMGSNPKTFQYQENTKVLYPAGKKGYQFLGWYRTDTKKYITILGGTIRNDITLKAQFKKLKVQKGSKVSVKRSKTMLTMQVKAQKDVAGYELQYWKKGGKKVTLTGTVTRYQLLKFSSTQDYYFRARCFAYDSTGSKVYGAYSKVTTSKGKKSEKAGEK